MKKANVIWIFGDQHRAQALSCNGDPNVNTPNLDRMAAEGVNFRRAVSGYPLCCPFRGSLITGIYPHKCVPGHEYALPRGMKTIAHSFNDAGYDSAWFGKWHLGGFKEKNGRAVFHTIEKEDRGGFNTWLGYENNNSQWDSWVHGHASNGEEIERYRLPGYETDCLTDILIDYLKEKGDKLAKGQEEPFFAALSVQPPHDPYIAPEEFMAKYNPQKMTMRPNVPNISEVQDRARRNIAGAYAMIENLDWNVGRIRSTLLEAGLDDDTYIIFFSDHGDMHGSHGQSGKTSPWEESIRIPFIINRSSSLYDSPSEANNCIPNHVDIAPTTLGLCDLEIPEGMQGQDYSGIYRRDKQSPCPPDSAFLQSVVPTGHSDSIDQAWRGITTVDGWKYVCFENQNWLMFNLNEDPYELVNLAHNSKYHKKREELHERLEKWLLETDDSFSI